MSNSVLWYTTRGAGAVSLILLTCVVVLGVLSALRVQSQSWPRFLTTGLHRNLALMTLVFLALHIVTAVVDPFTHFGWNEILIPLASHYRPVWMALGIVGLYLGIAIGISTLLRKRIGYSWWRRLHVLTLGIFALAAIHGLGTGSDTQTWWALGIYLVSIALVGSLLCRRVFFMKGKHKQAPVRPAARSTSAALQSNPRALNGARGAATHTTQQKRAEVARMR